MKREARRKSREIDGEGRITRKMEVHGATGMPGGIAGGWFGVEEREHQEWPSERKSERGARAALQYPTPDNTSTISRSARAIPSVRSSGK